jgi:DNA replication protein DnaC
MMKKHTVEKLKEMKLHGMARAYEEQQAMPESQSLPFDDRLGMLVDREETDRQDRRYQRRLKSSRLREAAAVEDIDFNPGRGLDKGLILTLASCKWIDAKQHLLITGPTGTGKTFVSCALANKAMQQGYNVRYVRLPRLFQDFAAARASGEYAKLLASLSRVDVLALDDWGLAPLSGDQRRDFLELVEDRYGAKSLIMTSQLPVDKWFDVVGDATVADAILDRIVHRSHRLDLRGESVRRKQARAGTKEVA